MRRIFLTALCSLFLLSSCALEIKKEITIALFSDLSWEEETGERMWFKVRYFDGESVKTDYLYADEREIKVEVSPSSLSVFVFYPLGSLTPFGGYWEPGREDKVYVEPQLGYFAQMLVDAAETLSVAVKELSVDAIRADNPDLGAIKRESFLSSLYSGELSKSRIELSKKYTVPLDGVLSGYWASLFGHSSSFSFTGNGEGYSVSLFPGIWYYLNKERDLILEIVISDEGEYWVKHKAKPKWS